MKFAWLTSGKSAKKESKKEENLAEKSKSEQPYVENGISDEIVAVIAAAVAAYIGRDFSIRSIRREKGMRPVWSSAGIYENTSPF